MIHWTSRESTSAVFLAIDWFCENSDTKIFGHFNLINLVLNFSRKLFFIIINCNLVIFSNGAEVKLFSRFLLTFNGSH